MPTNSQQPYHPIIYVRGFAATQGEIEETVADPYMGFNIGSTKARMAWTGDVKRFFFESPLVRLMSDHGYGDVFVDGEDLVAAERPDCVIPYRSIIHGVARHAPAAKPLCPRRRRQACVLCRLTW
ncbi:MAG: hypothetical protein NTW68_04310, partial [candidate division NC10 bacterium]|nr:hypothetical protein [candidate division NC10 bacterium]